MEQNYCNRNGHLEFSGSCRPCKSSKMVQNCTITFAFGNEPGQLLMIDNGAPGEPVKRRKMQKCAVLSRDWAWIPIGILQLLTLRQMFAVISLVSKTEDKSYHVRSKDKDTAI